MTNDNDNDNVACAGWTTSVVSFVTLMMMTTATIRVLVATLHVVFFFMIAPRSILDTK